MVAKGKSPKQSESIALGLAMVLLCGTVFYIVTQKKNNVIIHHKQYVHPTPPPPPPPRAFRRINVPSRGEPPAFKNVGYISNTNKNSDVEVLSLYGRPTYRGSDNWNYYTMHEGVRVPVENCDRTRGCREKYDGDKVNVGALNSDFQIGLYNDDAPRYIPY